jgi:hypothetical protein
VHAVVEKKSGESACVLIIDGLGMRASESRLFALLGPTGYFLRLWLVGGTA